MLTFGLIGSLFWGGSQIQAATLSTRRVATGLYTPVYVTAPSGDFNRIFILELYSGEIKILENGELLPQPFLNLGPRLTPSPAMEQGLLCMAFHPLYAQNGYFYVVYTDYAGASVVARYHVTANPDVADYNSEQIVLRLINDHPNQNVNTIAFGADGYLYISVGDGLMEGFPEFAQLGNDLHGKILRINVNGGTPYVIPPGNPFVSTPGFRPEIWALGLRQPWRFSIDRLTGDLYIGEVGNFAREEVDFQPAGVGGLNYGWPVYEGTQFTGFGSLNPQAPLLTDPLYEYQHNEISNAIVGGFVYRGNRISGLQGAYLFGDYSINHIFSLTHDEQVVTRFQDLTLELSPGGSHAFEDLCSFGQDASGELYLTDISNGSVYKIEPASNLLDVSVDPLGSPIVIGPGGGTFTYRVRVINNNPTPVHFDFWNDLYTPANLSQGPQMVRSNLLIPAGATLTRSSVSQSVPGSAAAGTYYLRAFVGDYPAQYWDVSWFSFVKQAASGDEAIVQDWRAGGWEQDSEPSIALPTQTGLVVCSPNPFNPTTALSFKLQAASYVNLKVYDTAGRLVTTLVDGMREAGPHQATFDASNLPSGIYLYQIQAGGWSATGKMALIK
jgi:glucose/arabinose dehydrogenase